MLIVKENDNEGRKTRLCNFLKTSIKKLIFEDIRFIGEGTRA